MSTLPSPEALAYYSQDTLQFTAIQGERGVVRDVRVDTPTNGAIESFDPDSTVGVALGEAVTRLYDSVEVRQATVNGEAYTIEVGVVEGCGDRTRLHNATYSSSLVANHGNGFEVARDAALDPETTQVYVGAPGIGLTSPLTAAEQQYLRRYGSMLDATDIKDIRALPFIHAIGRVLHDMGLSITDLHSDSAGALPSLAYGVTFGGGNILSCHQNVRPGIKSVGALSLAYGMIRTENIRSKAHAAVTPDALGMGSDKVAFTNDNLSEEFKQRELSGKTSAGMLLSNLIGLGKGPDDYSGDPLISDNVTFAQANGDARILLTVGSRDPLAESRDLDRRLQRIARGVSLYSRQPVHAVNFSGMSHSVQTHYPQYLRAVANHLLLQP